MIKRTPPSTQKEIAEAMTRCLEEGLCSMHGKSSSIVKLEREPFKGSSSFATELLTAYLANNESIKIFFKDLNPANQLQEARDIRQEIGLERSRRELLMYRHVLHPLRLGTPTLYAYRWDPAHSIYWIFLEHAGPKRLSRLGDFSLWVEAARWIARLHSVDYKKINDVVAVLPRYEEDHYHKCALQIQKNYTSFSQEQQSVVDEALMLYKASLSYLENLPTCLIHGEYFGKNVMIRPAASSDAIAVIDWETAALGPRCIDLVSIMAGRWTQEQRNQMKSAYFESYEQASGKKVNVEVLDEELAHVALYRGLWWVGYWSEGDDAHIERWIRELDKVLLLQK